MAISCETTRNPVPHSDTVATTFRAYLAAHASGTAPLRYHVMLGALPVFEYGFANKQAADRFISQSSRHFGLDWRAGWVWRVRGLRIDLSIVDRNLIPPKSPAKNS
jgi:hypothetical protein